MTHLPRVRIKTETPCTKCKDTIEPPENMALYQKQLYCECCVEDYEEEGRPIDD